MSDNWEVKSKMVTNGYMFGVLATGGLALALPPSYEYVVENKETGDRRTVIADNPEQLGRKIEEGKFSD